MATEIEIWVNIGSGNGLLPDGTKPSARSSDIHLRASSQEITQPSITEIIWKIKYIKFDSNFPGDYELNVKMAPPLSHWGRDKMDAISQTTSSSAFSWTKIFEFWLKQYPSIGSDNGLAPARRQAII